TPEEALSWLINHEECEVSVHEHTEPLAHASESKDVLVLMEEMTAAVAPPERHQSVRPGSRVVPLKDSTPPVHADDPPPSASTEVDATPSAEPAAGLPVVDKIGSARRLLKSEITPRLDALAQRLRPRLNSLPIKFSDDQLRSLIVSVPLFFILLFVLGIALLLQAGKDGQDSGSDQSPSAQESPKD